jgi:hypothetical protein
LAKIIQFKKRRIQKRKVLVSFSLSIKCPNCERSCVGKFDKGYTMETKMDLQCTSCNYEFDLFSK